LLIKLPIISKIIRTYSLASISNILGLLLAHNTSLVSALKIASETNGNFAYRKVLNTVAKQTATGIPMTQALSRFPQYFSKEYCDLVAIGEQTGKLCQTFIYAHTLYARDLDVITKTMSSSIEPILMVIIGLLIGAIALSVVSPMYSITSHLHAT
jgi:type IV pilus assembly protein PilC